MDITPDIVGHFRASFFGQFGKEDTYPTEKVIFALQEASYETGGSRWGEYGSQTLKQRGMFYLAAHILTQPTSADLKTTSFGQQYQKLRRRVGMGAIAC
ncbi:MULTISPECIES: DUF4054 domain-containing protein [Aeromonas]|uniref:DUF4054 domain-containing protein n=1 Tax=Aeromonas TaxID=642 RepID=UPI000382365B|nr:MULTISPECIES: DUF4054 domain-containing protein [Aeromonas]MCF5851364.1 DUF4054 domain-containing protein [Aeromonas veronii]MCF5855923.1 DUF4054 domain-containing protein [Aeromonas veronii]MCX9106402.1 DUF4054 domain-containing protein [Aeromonas veronii]MCX9121486.1 DUF4054 domain-containing protein [Aeromonas veronii]QWL68018.1 DUF4054 domain-containing protein [Aeromonas jandaei]